MPTPSNSAVSSAAAAPAPALSAQSAQDDRLPEAWYSPNKFMDLKVRAPTGMIVCHSCFIFVLFLAEVGAALRWLQEVKVSFLIAILQAQATLENMFQGIM